MKKYFYFALIVVVLLVLSTIQYQRKQIEKYKNLYNTELCNIKAYQTSNSDLKNKALQYQMTIDNLKSSKDSVDIKISKVIKELKLKDKQIEYLQYQSKEIKKTDTIHLNDTIFISNTNVDTTLIDEWYKLNLKLKYPSTVVVTPEFKSEQYVIINNKKEYINTPSKIFFIRWFQKKHTVVEINIIEKSPYILNKTNKFIKVLK